MVLIYTTCKDIAQAKDLGKRIIKARVAACVNMWEVESMYFGDGDIQEGREAVLLVKTNENKIADIENFLIKNHTYSTPLVASVIVDRLNREYKTWMTTVIS